MEEGVSQRRMSFGEIRIKLECLLCVDPTFAESFLRGENARFPAAKCVVAFGKKGICRSVFRITRHGPFKTFDRPLGHFRQPLGPIIAALEKQVVCLWVRCLALRNSFGSALRTSW